MSHHHFEQPLHLDAAHPVFAGHFPGRPLVPAVLLLEQVALALRAWRGQRLVRVVEAKFVAPLLPNEVAVVRLLDGVVAGVAPMGAEPGKMARVRFEIQRDGVLLARGVVEGAA